MDYSRIIYIDVLLDTLMYVVKNKIYNTNKANDIKKGVIAK